MGFLLILALYACGSAAGKAKAGPEGSYNQDEHPLTVIGYIADEDWQLEAQELAGYSDESFHAADDVPTFGFSTARHWLKLRVLNGKDYKMSRILEVNNPILNQCNLYELRANRAVRLYRAGDDYAFSERPLSHLNILFPIDVQANGSKEYLLEVSSAGEQLQVPLRLRSASEINLRDEKDRLLQGSYFGIILFVLLFNLFIYLIIRERSSLYYVAYVFFLLMLQLSLGGFAYRYLWPESPYLANIANPFFASASIYALIRFTQYFLQLYEFYPRLHKAFTWVSYAVAANCLLALIYTPLTFHVSVLAINSIALLLNILIIPVAFMVMRRGFKPARYFLLAFVVLVITVFFFVLNNFGLTKSDFYAAYGLQIGSAAEVILLSFAIVDKFKRFREEAFSRLVTINTMKAKANEELEQKVTERTEEIQAQKAVVENQKEEILSSIRYAERIQKSLLPSQSSISQLFHESFVLYKPRDIVSGDFYWFGQSSEENPWRGGPRLSLFAAVDCTGHGVPGALMSMLGHNGLDRCVNHPEVNSPASALRFINNEIVRSLQQSGEESSVRDGMDLVLCAYNPLERKLFFAGAKNNLYVFRDGNFIELKGDRISLGADFVSEEGLFTDRELQLQEGDTLYAFTDGFPDQFGGPNDKKLKTKPLLQIISELASHSLKEQEILLAKTFEMWRGDNEQIDDVCLLGIRV